MYKRSPRMRNGLYTIFCCKCVIGGTKRPGNRRSAKIMFTCQPRKVHNKLLFNAHPEKLSCSQAPRPYPSMILK